MSYWGFPRYVSVGEKKQKSKKKLEQLRKKNKNIEPVVIEGRTWRIRGGERRGIKTWRNTPITVIE